MHCYSIVYMVPEMMVPGPEFACVQQKTLCLVLGPLKQSHTLLVSLYIKNWVVCRLTFVTVLKCVAEEM